jgi:mannosyltransferase
MTGLENRTVKMKYSSSGAWLVPFSMLVIIILVGTGLRFFHLDHQSLWFDESISLAIARDLTPSQILANIALSIHPPLYYLLLHFWVQAAGINDYSARFPSVVSSLLSIPLIYQVGRSLFNHKVGLWAAFMLAVMPFQIQYAQEARMYALLLLLTLVTLLSFVRATQTGRLRWWIAYLVAFILGLYTHYFIGFVVLSYHFFAAIYRQRYRRIWPAILITDMVALVAFLPQVRIFLREFGVVLSPDYWLDSPSLINVLATMYFLIFGDYLREPLLIYIGLFVTLASLAIGLYEIFARKTDKSSLCLQIYLLIGAFAPIILVFIISQFKPIYLIRTLIICTPFLILLLAVALQRTHFRSPLPYLAIVTGALVMLVLYGIYVNPAMIRVKAPMREAARHIWQDKKSSDLVIHISRWTALPFTFYSQPSENYLLLGDPYLRKSPDVWEALGVHTIAIESLRADQRLWLVMVPSQTGDFQREQLQRLGANRPILVEDSVGHTVVRLYHKAH